MFIKRWPKIALNGGPKPKFRLGVSILCLRPSSKQLSRRAVALLEFFRPRNGVFTPHFLREITSVLGVYGVNRNLLIEICPKPHINRCESTGQPSNRSVTEFFFFFLTFRFTRGVAPDPPCPPSELRPLLFSARSAHPLREVLDRSLSCG